jgi:uncharacterized protein YprB with RNaseH-like and TPR domain
MHGRSCVRDAAARIAQHGASGSLLTGGAPARAPLLFIDLETTGLSGGAGTYAFLVGCASFTPDGALTFRQYLMTGIADEPVLLELIARELDTAGALVSFNGKSFDAPVLETRYLFHRRSWPGASLTHLDALHPSRQLWGNPATGGAAYCTLSALESHVLGARRTGDLPGVEVPARYFQFLRTGDFRLLDPVLEHNRRDLLSLAVLTGKLLELVSVGPSAETSACEALALGRIYRRAGLEGRAHDAFQRALALSERRADAARLTTVKLAALHALALSDRRSRRYVEAAERWRMLAAAPGCPSPLRRTAAEALAIHHEHRVRDLATARTYALQSRDDNAGHAWQAAVARRLTRIDRKLERGVGRARFDPPEQMRLAALGLGD